MTRKLIVGAAQLGPIARADTRTDVVGRLLRLMEQGKEQGCDLIVYPELALTTFFPRWFMENQQEVDVFFERDMPGPETQPLFDRIATPTGGSWSPPLLVFRIYPCFFVDVTRTRVTCPSLSYQFLC